MFDFLEYQFFINALIAVVILSVATAVGGTYIVTRRLVFVSGGVTHTSFGGLGLGYYFGVSPFISASVFATAAALLARHMERNRGLRSDSAIGIIWALGMAIGIFFVFLTSGYVPELNTFLFGNVLTVSTTDLWVAGAFTCVMCGVYALFRRLILAISFDYDFAVTRNLPASAIEILMTIFMALTIVMSIRMVGIMLLMSLITIPQVCAELFTRRYGRMMILSALISLCGCIGGLIASWYLGVPASCCIVLMLALIAGACYGWRNIFCPQRQRWHFRSSQ